MPERARLAGRRQRVGTRLSAAVAALIACLPIGAARADLDADASKLVRAWSQHGSPIRLEPRLLERGDLLPLPLPRWATNPSTPSCTQLALLGTRSANFVARFLPARGDDDWYAREWPEASTAGALELTRCGRSKSALGRLLLEMRSPRGVLEFVAIELDEPASGLLSVLPARDPGPTQASGTSGPRPRPAPLAERAKRLEQRLNLQGAHSVSIKIQRGTEDGSGGAQLALDAGCHHLSLLGEVPASSDRVHDLDLEVSTLPDSELTVVDDTEASDASVQLCQGDAAITRLRYVGALPHAALAIVHAEWPLPPGLPLYWGPRARGRMAMALGEQQLPALKHSPVFSALGVQGNTNLPLELEPGACYLAAVAHIRGAPSGLAMAAAVGSRVVQNRLSDSGYGTSMAFCAGAHETATLQVEARGTGVTWLLGVWQTARLSSTSMEAP